MRIPVFARRANPAIDRPILRKSRFYAEQQVSEGRADWVDDADPRKGIVCREVLHFGYRALPEEKPRASRPRPGLAPAELPGIKFKPPPTSLRELPHPELWNWTNEAWPSDLLKNDLLRLSPDPRSPLSVAVLPTQNSAYDSGELPL